MMPTLINLVMMNTYTTFASWDAVKQYAYEHTITYYGKNKTNEDDYYYINSEILRTLRIVPSKLGMPHTADDSFIEQSYREAPSDAANEYGKNVRKHVANGIWDAYRFLSEMRKSFKRSDWVVKTDLGYTALDGGRFTTSRSPSMYGDIFKKHLNALEFSKNEYGAWEAYFTFYCMDGERKRRYYLVSEDTLQDTIIRAESEFDRRIDGFLKQMKEEAVKGHENFEVIAWELWWGKALPKEVVRDMIADFKLPEEEIWVTWQDNFAAGGAHRILGMAKVEDYVKTDSSKVVATGAYRDVEPVFKELKKTKDLFRQHESKKKRIADMLAEIKEIENEIKGIDKALIDSSYEIRTLLSA
jgi:hypothetical protein